MLLGGRKITARGELCVFHEIKPNQDMKKLQLQSVAKATTNHFDIEKAKGRPMLQWVGKRPLDKIEYYPAQEKEFYGDKNSKDFNRLFWGDNLQVLAHLLKEYRGKVDLIYIDPPFDSKADYVKKVQLRGEKIDGVSQSLLEEKQYTDIWEKDEYLQFMYERLLLMRELLSDKGSICLHADWHKGEYLRLLMDEVFGDENFQNEVIWYFTNGTLKNVTRAFANQHNNLFIYNKNKNLHLFNELREESISQNLEERFGKYANEEGQIFYGDVKNIEKSLLERVIPRFIRENGKEPQDDDVIYELKGIKLKSVWNIPQVRSAEYPTEKPPELINRIIKAFSNEGDVVADFFVGSGTTSAVAQKLGRKWLACDINLGAIQTTTKRLNQIIQEQQKGQPKLLKEYKGLSAFKIYNVNDYDVFKNEIEAKEVVIEMYGTEPIKRSYFDGVLDNNFVKVMPINRVLNKLDIKTVLKNVGDKIDTFSVKKKSKSGEAVYEEGVLIIASGVELDVHDFLKKENKTGVKVEIRDILTDKKNLIFKKKPEAKIEVKTKDKKLLIEIKEFYSPILMRKLELENGKILKKDHQAKVEDFKQIVDSVAIDIDYNDKLFNAEIMDLPSKKELIKSKYDWEYPKKGKYTIAVKVVDVLGEEYFETFEISI